MKYRVLGKTGLKVSVIGLGTWQFGGEWGKSFSPSETESILKHAQNLGINLLDTAECYGPDHLSERLIGQAIKGEREKWIIATKFGHHFEKHNDRKFAFAKNEVAKQLDDSLRALQTDYIDLYQFHSSGDEFFFQEDLWAYLNQQVQAGKIRHLGASVSRLEDPIKQVEAASQYGIQAIQVVYNRLDQLPESHILPACIKSQLGVLARVPLASGYLSGKYAPGAQFGNDDVRSSHDKEKTIARLQSVAEIKRHEVPEGINMAQWALAWCLRRPEVTSVIPGGKDKSQVTLNATAADLNLTFAN